MDTTRFPQIVRDIYKAVNELEAMFPGRRFTPDGHLLGSLGEALAAYYFGIQLSAASTATHDGCVGSRKVQVKATQGNRIAISSEPDHLIVLGLDQNGGFCVHYNGPGDLVWALVRDKSMPKNSQYQVSVSALRRLQEAVPISMRLTPVRPLPASSPPAVGRQPDV